MTLQHIAASDHYYYKHHDGMIMILIVFIIKHLFHHCLNIASADEALPNEKNIIMIV